MPKNTKIVPKFPFANIEIPNGRLFSTVAPVRRFGHLVCRPGEKYHFNRRSRLEFCLRLESAEEFAEDEIDGRVYRYRFPHLFVKRPNVVHDYQTRSSRRAVFIVYDAEQCAYFTGAGFPLDTPGWEFTLTPTVSTLIDELVNYETLAHDCGMPDQIDLAAIRLLTAVYTQHREKRQISATEQAIRKIAAYLECHACDNINAEALAREHGFSRRSFFRHWNAVYPLTPAQFVLEKRMAQAQQLLTETDTPVAVLSEHLGFCNSGYFIQMFKRKFGISPAAFRRAGTVVPKTE